MLYIRCQYPCLLNLLAFCALLGFAAVWGCSESENSEVLAPVSTTETTTQPISREMMAKLLADVEKNVFAAEMEITPQVAAAPMAPMQRPPTIAETMAALRLEFPGNVLDEDFTKIREIINSETYVEFLKRTYPQENQFQNFDEFWALASVDEEWYLEFLNMYFTPPLAEPTAEDVDVLHYITLHYRNLNVRKYHGEDREHENNVNMMMNVPVRPWIGKRFVGESGVVNILLWVKVFAHHRVLVKELQEEDQEKIHTLFVENGTQKGFLLVALLEPVRLGHVIKDFTDVQVFQRWVDGEFSKNAGQQGQRPDK
ncbi:hypothetical protein F4167_13980 [Candidatus Poribacteria bacterium]|nr:hypothetical protein [Candidatus Poribacteria bacterium]